MTCVGELYTELVIGSHLYGGARPESDIDLLRIYKAPLYQVVSNARETIPSSITETEDVRRMYLHDFVMGLGNNPENTLIWLHYLGRFDGLDPDWILRKSTAERMYRSGYGMFAAALEKGADVPNKQLGHAFRYLVGAASLMVIGDNEYPLTDLNLKIYQGIRNDDRELRMPDTWEEFLAECSCILPDSERNLDEMARWVLEQY